MCPSLCALPGKLGRDSGHLQDPARTALDPRLTDNHDEGNRDKKFCSSIRFMPVLSTQLAPANFLPLFILVATACVVSPSASAVRHEVGHFDFAGLKHGHQRPHHATVTFSIVEAHS